MSQVHLDKCVTLTDAELHDELSAIELESRELAVRKAAVTAVIDQRGSYRADGHRSVRGYLRATCDTSGATITRELKLSELVSTYPNIGELLAAGYFSVDHALEIARIHTNPRIRDLLGPLVGVLTSSAEAMSFREFRLQVDQLITLVDQDGAFADLADAIDGRDARVVEVGGTADIAASGGDPITTAQLVAVFDAFVEREWAADRRARRERYGDAADEHDLPRTASQRRFDALVAIFSAAAAEPGGDALPEPTVGIVIDADTAHDALADAGVILPNGRAITLDDDGTATDHLVHDLAATLIDDPDAFLHRRRCTTSTGAPIHPTIALRWLLTGHIRRVVVDSTGVVVDYGTKQRLFTGLAREAALLLADVCEHPGCELPAKWCQVDHNTEWSAGGPTDQANATIRCGHHNRHKHGERLHTERTPDRRSYTVRADGTIILPTGRRPPSLPDTG